MIKKIVTFIIIIVLLVSFSQTLVLGSYLFNKQNYIGEIAKDVIISAFPHLYTYGLDSKIFFKGKYESSNKVDIVIGNHINIIDFIIYLLLIKHFDDRNIYLVFKKSIVFFPGAGFILHGTSDFKLKRKMEDDEQYIINTLKDIKDGIILIFPEGTRYTDEKFKLAKQYSKDNNLPSFNNILFPKMKGLWTIYNVLNNNNRLGNIIDISCIIENFKNKETHFKDIITKPFGNTYCIINSYNVPNNITNYDNFKSWFLDIWIKKDKTLNITKYDNFTELIPEMKSYNYLILIVMVTLFIYLTIHTNGLYIPFSLLLTYGITSFIG